MMSPFVYLPHRAVLSLRGPDTITLLERLVTHATDDWEPGQTRYGALLTPQGKILSDYLALRIDDGILLDTAAEFIDDLAKRLKMFRLRSAVEIERLEDVFVFAGTESAPEDLPSISGVQYVYRDPRYSGGRVRGMATRESWSAEHGDHPEDGSRPIAEYHADRIAHCVPEQGFDFGSADAFPADINMDVLGGVALNKGCFVGQEVVSRMHRRGQIRKRTLPLTVPTETTLSVGADLLAPATVGVITSCQAEHGLARIRVDRWLKAVDQGQSVTLDETPVTITKPDWLLNQVEAMK
ncbi:MAG: folate-binding protein [Pseudomonadota bacterium]